MKRLWLCLPLFVACVAAPEEKVDSVSFRLTDEFPFRVAILPIAALDEDVTVTAEYLDGGAAVLATSFDEQLFVEARAASSLTDALQTGAELIFVCEAEAIDDASGEVVLSARFYDSSFQDSWMGAYPKGQAGLVLAIEAPLQEVWVHELSERIRSSAGTLLNSGLAPFRLDPEFIEFRRRGSGLAMTGAIQFNAGSRSRRLRSMTATLADGRSFEARLDSGDSSGDLARFEMDLPELTGGELITIEVRAGSRVRYLRRYAVRLLVDS